MTTYQLIQKNKRESWILIFSFLIVISLMGFVFDQYFGDPGILVFAVIFSMAGALISYYFSDRITLSLSKAEKIDRDSNRQLYTIVENLCIAAGIPTPTIYIIQDAAPNAFATGRDPQHAVICYTTGILQKLDKTELEGVTAHELSHIGNYDIRVMTLVVVLVGIVTLIGDWFLRASFFGGGRRRNNTSEGNEFAVVMLAGGLLLAILAPIVATLIKLAVSRQREYLADASGALLTRYPEGLANALEKISSDTSPLREANKATAHLYIVNPFHDDRMQAADTTESHGSRSWFSGLFNTHPPIEDRIKRLREMNL